MFGWKIVLDVFNLDKNWTKEVISILNSFRTNSPCKRKVHGPSPHLDRDWWLYKYPRVVTVSLCVWLCVSITGVGLAPSSCTMTDSVRMNSYPAGQQLILVGHFECHSEGYFDFDFYCSVKIEGRLSIRQANVEVFALDILPKNSWRNNNNLCFWILLFFSEYSINIYLWSVFIS